MIPIVTDFKSLFLSSIFNFTTDSIASEEHGSDSSDSDERSFSPPDILTNSDSILKDNIRGFYHSLPFSSKIKSSVIHTFFAGMTSFDISKILEISTRRIRLANEMDIQPLSYFLTALGFERDVLGERENILYHWLDSHSPCLSGRNKRYFDRRGDVEVQYSYYFTESKNDFSDYPPVSFSKFNEVVKH